MYMTATRSAISATTPRLWVMIMIDISKSLLQRLHQLEDLRLDGHIQRRGRLVGDQQAGVAGQGHGDHGALAHAAGQLVRVLADALLRGGDAHLLQHLDGRAPCASFWSTFWCSMTASVIWLPTVCTGESEVIGSWKIMAISLPRMLRIRSPRGSSVARSTTVAAAPAEEDLALDDLGVLGRQQAQHREGGHGLAAARFADQAQRLARGNAEGDAIDGAHDAIHGVEVGLQVLDLEQVVRVGMVIRTVP